jgi:hypothetical protein
MRTSKNLWTVYRFHLICCFLTIRFAMISLTADSTNPVEIGVVAWIDPRPSFPIIKMDYAAIFERRTEFGRPASVSIRATPYFRMISRCAEV